MNIVIYRRTGFSEPADHLHFRPRPRLFTPTVSHVSLLPNTYKFTEQNMRNSFV